MKKVYLLAALLMAGLGLSAQTNIQEMYDFNRGHFTTTIEGFHVDRWGSTFFFTDIYHPFDNRPYGTFSVPTGFYTEVSRAINFWHKSKLAPLSLHVEWNGGQFAANALLFGVEWFLHSVDYRNTFTFELMYKRISHQVDNIPMQFTFVWGMRDLFDVEGLTFSGFLDVWGEKCEWTDMTTLERDETDLVVLCEPQLWYNVGRHFGCPNLNVGGEVELAYNFTGGYHSGAEFAQNKGFNVAPCLGVKWVF